MAQYIEKSVIVAEIEKIKHKLLDHIISESDKEWAIRTAHQLNRIIRFINTLEVKEVDMPALDNGIMPVERWKEACEAASCHANYRKSKGLTETCDDYFVDGVQWADEHPIKAKEVDLDKEARHYLLYEHESPLSRVLHEIDLLIEMQYHRDIENAFKAGFKLGLKARKEKEV